MAPTEDDGEGNGNEEGEMTPTGGDRRGTATERNTMPSCPSQTHIHKGFFLNYLTSSSYRHPPKGRGKIVLCTVYPPCICEGGVNLMKYLH